jgi:hypothetical protein
VVDPESVVKILHDAARLVKDGEIIVFDSAALSAWLSSAPSTRDVDIVVHPPERGDAVEAVMGELSWYDERFDAHVDVCNAETLAAPESWPERARRERFADIPRVEVTLLHPHDVLFAKIERWEPQDRDHARRILNELPMTLETAERLAGEMPHRTGAIRDERRRFDFEAHYGMFLELLGAASRG